MMRPKAFTFGMNPCTWPMEAKANLIHLMISPGGGAGVRGRPEEGPGEAPRSRTLEGGVLGIRLPVIIAHHACDFTIRNGLILVGRV